MYYIYIFFLKLTYKGVNTKIIKKSLVILVSLLIVVSVLSLFNMLLADTNNSELNATTNDCYDWSNSNFQLCSEYGGGSGDKEPPG